MRQTLLWTLCLFCTTAAGAADKPTVPSGLSKAEADQGFESLFDGKTLTGWKGAVARTRSA